MAVFERRRIGRTALEVTALGLGCATLGGSRIPVSRQDAEAIIRAAWAAGVVYIDAAPYYGFGQAERCAGCHATSGYCPPKSGACSVRAKLLTTLSGTRCRSRQCTTILTMGSCV